MWGGVIVGVHVRKMQGLCSKNPIIIGCDVLTLRRENLRSHVIFSPPQIHPNRMVGCKDL